MGMVVGCGLGWCVMVCGMVLVWCGYSLGGVDGMDVCGIGARHATKLMLRHFLTADDSWYSGHVQGLLYFGILVPWACKAQTIKHKLWYCAMHGHPQVFVCVWVSTWPGRALNKGVCVSDHCMAIHTGAYHILHTGTLGLLLPTCAYCGILVY